MNVIKKINDFLYSENTSINILLQMLFSLQYSHLLGYGFIL